MSLSFDEEKYKELMDRLEAVEVMLSELEFTARIDAEYYRKIFLANEHLLLSQDNKTLDKMCSFLIGPFGSSFTVENYTDDTTYRYVRGKDVKPFHLQNNDNVYMPKVDYNRLKRYALEVNDVLISVVGTLGNVSIVTDENLPAIFSCKSTVLRCNDVNPLFLLTYLNTTLIRDLVLRKTRGAVQLGLNLDDLKSIIVVDFSVNFQTCIENIYKKSRRYLSTSKSLYSTAQNLLLSELGLADYTPTNEGISIKTLANSFGASGRLDAEYYQPKYDAVIRRICKYKHNTIGNLVKIKKSIEPGSDYYGDEGVPFVRVSNLSRYEISEPDIRIPFDTIKNISELFPKKDTVLLSKDGSVGIAYKVTKNMNCVTSSAILHLNVNNSTELMPDYFTLVLNSLIVQLQAERDAGGSIIQHWRLSEIEQVLIPILDIEVQKSISEKVQQSFDLCNKSAALLEYAKQAVEIAIEQGEDVAMKWLDNIKD